MNPSIERLQAEWRILNERYFDSSPARDFHCLEPPPHLVRRNVRQSRGASTCDNSTHRLRIEPNGRFAFPSR